MTAVLCFALLPRICQVLPPAALWLTWVYPKSPFTHSYWKHNKRGAGTLQPWALPAGELHPDRCRELGLLSSPGRAGSQAVNPRDAQPHLLLDGGPRQSGALHPQHLHARPYKAQKKRWLVVQTPPVCFSENITASMRPKDWLVKLHLKNGI